MGISGYFRGFLATCTAVLKHYVSYHRNDGRTSAFGQDYVAVGWGLNI